MIRKNDCIEPTTQMWVFAPASNDSIWGLQESYAPLFQTFGIQICELDFIYYPPHLKGGFDASTPTFLSQVELIFGTDVDSEKLEGLKVSTF